MKRLFLGCFLTSIAVLAAGCAAPAEDEDASSTDDALNEAPSQPAPDGVAPIVFELQPPSPRLNLNLDRDWSRAEVDVLDRVDYTPRWIQAEKENRPSFVSEIRDKVDNGVGSGNCRLKVGLKKAIVRCSWRF